jgi:hypothetical protein
MGFKETGRSYPDHPFDRKKANWRLEARKKAYRYICESLKQIHGRQCMPKEDSIIPLGELLELKEGLADPSPQLIALLRGNFGTSVSQSELEANLVAPFSER